MKDARVFFAFVFLSLLAMFSARYYLTGHGIDGDGIEFYSYLPSAFIDGDLDFGNQCRGFYDFMPSLYREYRYEEGKPPAGGIYSQTDAEVRYDAKTMCDKNQGEYEGYAAHTIGCAVLWTPFFLASLALTHLLNLFGLGLRADGIGHLTQYVTVSSSTLYAMAGLYLAYLLGGRLGIRSRNLMIAIAAIVPGTFLLQYFAIEPSLSQAVDYFIVTAFYFLLHRLLNGKTRRRDYAAAGVAAGIMVDVRPQNIAFVAVALAYWLVEAVAVVRKAGLPRYAKAELQPKFVFAVFAAIAAAPLFLAFKAIYGAWVPLGHQLYCVTLDKTPSLAQLLGAPKLYEVLFSNRHSLFVSTPLLIPAFIGFCLLFKERRKDRTFLLLVLAGFLAQLYFNSVVTDWWAGPSPGARRFTGTILLFILGLSYVFEKSKAKLLTYAAAAALVGFNLVYLFVHNLHLINPHEAVTYAEIVEAFLRFLKTRLGLP